MEIYLSQMKVQRVVYRLPIYFFLARIDMYSLPIYNIVKQDILVTNIERRGYNGK